MSEPAAGREPEDDSSSQERSSYTREQEVQPAPNLEIGLETQDQDLDTVKQGTQQAQAQAEEHNQEPGFRTPQTRLPQPQVKTQDSGRRSPPKQLPRPQPQPQEPGRGTPGKKAVQQPGRNAAAVPPALNLPPSKHRPRPYRSASPHTAASRLPQRILPKSNEELLSDNADMYEKLQERDVEIGNLKEDMRRIKQENGRLTARVGEASELTRQLEATQADVLRLETTANNQRTEISKLRDQLRDELRVNADWDSRNQQLLAQLTSQENKILSLSRDREELSAHCNTLEAQMAQLAYERDTAAQDCERLSQELQDRDKETGHLAKPNLEIQTRIAELSSVLNVNFERAVQRSISQGTHASLEEELIGFGYDITRQAPDPVKDSDSASQSEHNEQRETEQVARPQMADGQTQTQTVKPKLRSRGTRSVLSDGRLFGTLWSSMSQTSDRPPPNGPKAASETDLALYDEEENSLLVTLAQDDMELASLDNAELQRLKESAAVLTKLAQLLFVASVVAMVVRDRYAGDGSSTVRLACFLTLQGFRDAGFLITDVFLRMGLLNLDDLVVPMYG